jgi:hypothetical protein
MKKYAQAGCLEVAARTVYFILATNILKNLLIAKMKF